MLHGMSADGIGLANIALLMSMIRGLIFKGLIDQAEARLWLNNAAALIEEDKAAFTKSRGEAVTIIRELVSLLNGGARRITSNIALTTILKPRAISRMSAVRPKTPISK